jgi:hypothetical protein
VPVNPIYATQAVSSTPALAPTQSRHCRLFLVAVLSVATCGALYGEPVRVPGTRVSLNPPPGFSPAHQFPGFQNVDIQSSIMVTELPGPASAMKRGMTRATLASRGMTLLQSSTAEVGGDDALLLHVRQPSSSGDVRKWMLIAGDRTRTVMIVGSYPTAAPIGVGEAVKRSLLGADLGLAVASPNAFEGLQFRVTPTAALRVAGRVSNLLTLTESGTMTPSNPDGAVYVVGHSIGNVAIGDLRAFAETRLTQTTRMRGITTVSGRPITLDGLEAYELEAVGADARTARQVHIYQVIAPDTTGYFIIQGFIAAARAAATVPEFKKVTATFQRTTEP